MLSSMIMAYSTDLRKRVLDFIANSGSKAAAERTFGTSRRTIYNWLEAEDPLISEKPGPKGPRSIDYDVLQRHVADFPDKTLAERAKHFGVSTNGISYALSKLNITRKKDDDLQRTVSGKTTRVSLGTSKSDIDAWQNNRLYSRKWFQ